MRRLFVIGLCGCLLSLPPGTFPHASAAEPGPITLQRKLVSVDTQRRTWAHALGLICSRLGIPFLIELDTLTYRSVTMFHGKTNADAAKIATQFQAHLQNVTVEEVIRYLLKDQPRYRYEMIDGVVLHVYPEGIQNRTNYPLNTAIGEFRIEQRDLSRPSIRAISWYRKEFEALVDPLRIDLGNVRCGEFSTCLSPRVFHGGTLRGLLIELSKTCGTQWVFEPLPASEVKLRVKDWPNAFYPQGKNILERGGDWYQLHCLGSSEDTVEDGALR